MGSPPLMGFGLLVLAGLLSGPPAVASAAGEPPAHFFYQERAECYFGPGTERGEPRARFLLRSIYGRQEMLHFDSALGRFVALSPIAQSNVDRFNRDADLLRQMGAEVDRFCRHNTGIFEPFALRRKVQPRLQITPTDYEPSSRNTLLVCSVDSFYPPAINVSWSRNGAAEAAAMTTGLFPDGDWTYQVQVMLETKPDPGDVYACRVEHASLASPVSVEWKAQSDSARSKMWTGVVGILLGVVFVAAGLSLYLRNKKGRAVPQTTVGLMD